MAPSLFGHAKTLCIRYIDNIGVVNTKSSESRENSSQTFTKIITSSARYQSQLAEFQQVYF